MSLFFLIAFALLCAALYYLCPNRFKWVLLLLVSYAYYAYCGAGALPFLLLTTLSTWAGALFIGRIGARGKAARTIAMRSSKGTRLLSSLSTKSTTRA